jgi:hypothetical protein
MLGAVAVPVVACCAAPAGAPAQAAAAARAYPGPGWSAANPRTALTFADAGAGALAGLRVEGARSGRHAGRLRPLRGAVGAVFEPELPFAPGERVTVTAPGPIAGAADGRFTFRVAVPVPWNGRQPTNARVARVPPARPGRGIGSCRPRRLHLRTRPHFHPMAVCVRRNRLGRVAPGHLLVTPRAYPRTRRGDQHAVTILDRATGQPLWYLPRPDVARDLKTVTYAGERMLAFWQWRRGGRDRYVLLDRHYRRRGAIRAGDGYEVNTHELRLTPHGTAYLMAYERIRDARCDCDVSDVILQEIDVASGDVLFEWHAVDHIPLADTYRPRPDDGRSWDYVHANSIEPPADGGRTLIVSARNTSAVYGIDRETSEIAWILGGRADQFGLAATHPEWRFCAQHDARRLPDGDLTLFDNGGLALGNEHDCPLHLARALRFRLDPRARTVAKVGGVSSLRSSENGDGYYVSAMGSARRQANGNTVVSWGTNQRITEVTRSGEVVQAMRLGRYTYRAIRSEWTGLPLGRPRVAARRRHGTVHVWASWNGATEIDRWRLLAGPDPAAFAAVSSTPFRAFETGLPAPGGARYVAAEALGRDGSVLGRSLAVRVRRQ